MIRRVLMTAEAGSGVWTYSLELARALAEHGVSVLLAVMGPAPSATKLREAATIPTLELEHRPFALEWMEHPWADVRLAGDWLLNLEARWQPELCHLNGFAHAGCDFSVPRIVVAHSCIPSWHDAVHHGPLPGKWATYRRRVVAGLASADAVVAPTRWMLKELERHYGKQVRGEVIANARSSPGFQAARKDPVVFSAGRVWNKAKNLLVLDRAAEHVSWPVMIAGPTDHSQTPPGTFNHTGLLGELEPQGISQWMARASIYASPAKYDPFGLSVLEAALSGCALVLGDIPSMREAWADAAVFVDPNAPTQWAATINGLVAEPSLRRELARRAAERATGFSPRAQATAYLAIYQSLTQRTAHARAS
ncbi:MAG: glycosyltransferase family 4 protein [Archangium sp.]|nr:glycosyltransferase family 4 protein [Archangium sp.]MDP3157776.1 glycosyltransferase family 4 protein [Archangium sp.]MDP3571262.1 glycosyltransferase family 4 protein [Archangium sp.]